MLEFNIRNQEISRIDNFSPAEKSVEYLIAKFNFKTEDWNGATKRAIFRNVKSKVEKDAMLEDDSCMVPWEVLVGSSDIEVSVHGVIDTEEITTDVAVFNLDRTLSGGSASQEPSPTVYEQMLKEMQETKEIAQSVRNDADNGAFDGEKGDKGDAGAIEFKIVNELPTEDISESAMYLVPLSPSSENNEFAEYIYVDGHWEYIGSASVEVDVDDFVKKDDYATNDGAKAGVSKILASYGMGITGDGFLYPLMATNNEIDQKKQWCYNGITPHNLDYAVMKALSDSKLEWTEEQKQLARALLGVPLVNGNYGIQLRDNTLMTVMATRVEIDNKSNSVKAITPNLLDYAVKKALSDCKLSGDDVWTEEEKAKARTLLGIGDIDDTVLAQAVEDWLNEHPEALGSIFEFENKIKNGNFVDGTNFAAVNSTIEVTNNEIVATGTGVNQSFGINYTGGFSVNAGDILYVQAKIKSSKARNKTTGFPISQCRINTVDGLKYAWRDTNITSVDYTDYTDKYGTVTFDSAQSNINYLQFILQERTAAETTGNTLSVKNVLMLNLTELFGAGKEPSADDVYKLLSCFENHWFDGTVDIFGRNAMVKRTLDEENEIVEKDMEVTVGANGDFSTINKALAYLSKFYPSYKSGGVNINIKILSGTTINEQVFVSRIDLQHITIIAEDEYVPVNCDGWGTTADAHDSRGDKPFFACENAGKFPTIGCVFKLVTNTDNIQTCGLLANRGSEAVVLENSGFDGFYDGVISNNESSVTIREGISRNMTRWGVHSRHNGEISARSIDATNCGIAAYADRVADLDVREATLDGSTQAIVAYHTSRINANGCHANNCGDGGSLPIVDCQYASVINCATLEVTNAQNNIFSVGVYGTIIANDNINTGLADGKTLYSVAINTWKASGVITA